MAKGNIAREAGHKYKKVSIDAYEESFTSKHPDKNVTFASACLQTATRIGRAYNKNSKEK